MSLAKKVVEGDARSAARLMRDIEDEIPSARKELREIQNHRSFLLEGRHMAHLIEERIRQKFVDELKNMLLKKGLERIEGREFDEIIRSLIEKKEDPYGQAEQVVTRILG
jgi:hypothetical protein